MPAGSHADSEARNYLSSALDIVFSARREHLKKGKFTYAKA